MPTGVLFPLLLIFGLSISSTNSQNVTVQMLSKIFQHAASQKAILQLAQQINSVTNVSVQKTKIKTWANTNWVLKQKTFSFYDNRTYAIGKACGFMDHRHALKHLMNVYFPPQLQKDGYLTAAVAEKVRRLFWSMDRFNHQFNSGWYGPWPEFRAFAKLLINDKAKRAAFLDKYYEITDRYSRAELFKSKAAFDFQIFDMDLEFDRTQRAYVW